MITVSGLTKQYGGRAGGGDGSFSLQPRPGTGLLRPHRARKTTTMRLMTGLVPASAGTSTVDGRPSAALPNPGAVVGTLLDASAVHPGRTGRTHLRLLAATIGVPVARVDEVLALVGLTDAAGRRIGGYSLGVRQRLGGARALLAGPPGVGVREAANRPGPGGIPWGGGRGLGIAGALLAAPPVLVFDEPANGLDPEGIRWMRDLLRGHAARGGTVLLSSHLLGEVEHTVDRLLVIGVGRIVADGPVASLLGAEGTAVRAVDAVALAAALETAGFHVQHAAAGGLVVAGAAPAAVGSVAAAAGLALIDLRPVQRGLEELFFQLTNAS